MKTREASMWYRSIRGAWYQARRWKNHFENKSQKLGFYSAFGEDGVIATVFSGLKDGFYVDIGSGHPILDSNTYFFYKNLKWRGIAVDAIKSNCIQHNLFRPHDDVIWAAIGIKSNEITVYEYPANEFTTTDKKRYEELKLEGKFPSTIKLFKCLTLESLLKQKNEICMQESFMSIDVEGGEQEVLLSVNWDEYRPALVCIEDITNTNKETQKLLEEKGYAFLARLGLSNIFKLKSSEHLLCRVNAKCNFKRGK